MENDATIRMLQTGEADVPIDAVLESKVMASLHAHARLHSESIWAHVEDRRVYLEGSVPDAEDRELARQCVENIFGIRSVYNNITFPFRLNRAG